MNTSQKLQPHFYFGEAVDRYLESESAIAQAVDRDTIVLSSSVFALPKTERRTIILHELAHVQQLARGGNDPVSALEDEAWEAAETWSAGKPFEIRGRCELDVQRADLLARLGQADRDPGGLGRLAGVHFSARRVLSRPV